MQRREYRRAIRAIRGAEVDRAHRSWARHAGVNLVRIVVAVVREDIYGSAHLYDDKCCRK